MPADRPAVLRGVRRERLGGRVLRGGYRRGLSRGTIRMVLTTGWEPDVPIDDTFVRRFVFALAEAWEPTVAALGGHVMRCAEFALADLGRPAGLANAVTLLQPLSHEGTLLDAVEDAVAGGTGTVALLSAWPTPDLTARGWQLAGHPPLHLRPPAPLPPAPAPRGLRVAPVTDATGVADFERVLVEGYPFPDVAPGTLFDERVLTATSPAPRGGLPRRSRRHGGRAAYRPRPARARARRDAARRTAPRLLGGDGAFAAGCRAGAARGGAVQRRQPAGGRAVVRLRADHPVHPVATASSLSCQATGSSG